MIQVFKKTIASTGVAQPIQTTSVKCARIWIQSDRANSALVMVGASDVEATTRGIEIPKPTSGAYMPPLVLESNGQNDLDLSQIYIIGTSSDIVNILAYTV
jgi:hypothetical protein